MQCRRIRDGDDAKSGVATANCRASTQWCVQSFPERYEIDTHAASAAAATAAANCAEKSRPLRPFESDYLTIRFVKHC